MLAIDPGDVPARDVLNVSRNNQASILSEQGEFEAALVLYRDALASSEREQQADPNNVTIQLRVAQQRLNAGETLIELRRFDEALSLFRQSEAVLDRHDREGHLPPSSPYREVLLPQVRQRATHCEAALSVGADPGVVKGLPPREAIFLLLHRARTLADRKDIEGVAATAGLIRDFPAAGPEEQLEKAAASIVCAGLLERADRLGDAKASRSRAREVLTEALGSKVSDLPELLARPRFAPLRQDPELGKLIAGSARANPR